MEKIKFDLLFEVAEEAKRYSYQKLYKNKTQKLLKKKGKELRENGVVFSELNKAQRKELGFGKFSKEDKEKYGLIPHWLFYLLPKKEKLISISGVKKLRKDADDDQRFGYVAYFFDKE